MVGSATFTIVASSTTMELGDADDHEDEPAVGLSSVGHLTAWRYNDLRFRVIRGL
jgi:hypothetical protein